MTARGQSIGISIGMLPQTLIVSGLDQLSFFIIYNFFSFLGDMEVIMVQMTSKYNTMEFYLEEGFEMEPVSAFPIYRRI
jgi:hypothetical protein